MQQESDRIHHKNIPLQELHNTSVKGNPGTHMPLFM